MSLLLIILSLLLFLVLEFGEYASLVSNDVNSNNGSLFHNNETNHKNTNHTYHKNANHKKRQKKKDDNLYVSNDTNHRLIDNNTTNQYYNLYYNNEKKTKKIANKKINSTFYKTEDFNPTIDLLSLETKPLVLSSRPVSRNAASRPQSSRIGNRPNPNVNINKVNDINNNNNYNSNNNSTFRTVRPKSANDIRRIGNSKPTESNSLTGDANLSNLNSLTNLTGSIETGTEVIIKNDIHELSTSVVSYMTTISVQVYSNTNSPRLVSPGSPSIQIDNENTIRLKTNDIIDEQDNILPVAPKTQSPSKKSPTRYTLTPTNNTNYHNDISSPNAITWDSALGGSMDNYINRLLLLDKPKEVQENDNFTKNVNIDNSEKERLNSYIYDIPDYDSGAEKNDNGLLYIKKSSRPNRSTLLSNDGNRLKEKKLSLDAAMKKRNEEVASLVISSQQKNSVRPSTANSHKQIPKNIDYPITMSVPLKDLEIEREFLLSLSKQLRQSKINNSAYNSPRGEAFIDDNIINKISDQLQQYKNSLTWDSTGYKKVIEDIEMIRQKENEEYLNVQKRMTDVTAIVFPHVNNSNNDFKNQKPLSNSNSKKTLTNMKYSEKDLLAFPTYPKFSDPEYRNTSVIKYNTSQLDDKSSLITLSLYEVSNMSPNTMSHKNNTIDMKNDASNEIEIKSGQDCAVVMKRSNIEKKVLTLPPVLQLESECMTFSPRTSEKRWQSSQSFKVRSQLEKGANSFTYPADAMRLLNPVITPIYQPPPPLGISSQHESFMDSSSSLNQHRPFSAPARRRNQ